MFKNVVRLRNGSEEHASAVMAYGLTLEKLAVENPVALYELWELCKDPTHKVWGSDTLGLLQRLSLVQGDGRVHDTLRNIVLSSLRSSDGGLDFALVNPIP